MIYPDYPYMRGSDWRLTVVKFGWNRMKQPAARRGQIFDTDGFRPVVS